MKLTSFVASALLLSTFSLAQLVQEENDVMEQGENDIMEHVESDIIGHEENDKIVHDFGRHRNLVYAKNKIAWPECIDLKMTVEECHRLIETEIAMGHVLTNIKTNLKYPAVANPDEVAKANDYYFRFAVPTNYLAHVTGFEIDGKITYELPWELTTGPVTIGPWDCRGLNPTQCCTKIKGLVTQKDKNGKYIDCWVQEESPIPYVKGTGVSYCAWEYDKVTSMYVPKEATMTRQKTARDAVKTKFTALITEMQGYLDSKLVAYGKLNTLSNNLHFFARMLSHVQKAAADIDAYLHPPNKTTTIFKVEGNLHDILQYVIDQLEKFNTNPFVFEHEIIVQSADEAGSYVKHVPQISTPTNARPCIP